LFVSCYLWDIFYTHRHVVRDSIQVFHWISTGDLWRIQQLAPQFMLASECLLLTSDYFYCAFTLLFLPGCISFFLPVAMFGNATPSLIGCGPQTTNVCPRGGKSWLLPLINSAGLIAFNTFWDQLWIKQ
jgi:hypothetical protein